MRIAMWSGPRNLSTAMMYSFAARGDCAVRDEPFYAPYLAATGKDHPMRAEILAAHETDPEKVARACAGPIPGGHPHVYLKVMPHQMLPGFPMDWAEGFAHVHLIRHPARVIASYGAKRDAPTAEDIGFRAQAELYRRIGGLIIDSHDIRANPEAALRALCSALGLEWTDRMLRWPKGGHPDDGVWAPHWYAAVHRSTGFAGPEGDLPALTRKEAELCENVLPFYQHLRENRLKI